MKSYKIQAVYERHEREEPNEVVTFADFIRVGDGCLFENPIGAKENNTDYYYRKVNGISISNQAVRSQY